MDIVERELVKNGGIDCGWDAADHKDFLRLRTQHREKTGTVAFVQAMARAVPLADTAMVDEHVKAYDTYLLLTAEKKELITKYKAAREEERLRKMGKLGANVTPAHKRLNSDLDLDLLSGQKRTGSVANLRASSISHEERQSMKERLKAWKEKKMDLDKKLVQERIAEEKKRKERLAKKIEEERAAKRELVEEFKFRKEIDK